MELESKKIKVSPEIHEGYAEGNDIMVITDHELCSRIEKRVRQVAREVCTLEDPPNFMECSRLILAMYLKRIAIEYNCYIQSWVTIDDACSECYNAATRNEEDDTTYGLIAAPTEPGAVIVAFMWLSDKQNFTPQARKAMIESGMNS